MLWQDILKRSKNWFAGKKDEIGSSSKKKMDAEI